MISIFPTNFLFLSALDSQLKQVRYTCWKDPAAFDLYLAIAIKTLVILVQLAVLSAGL